LKARGLDVTLAVAQGRYVPLDAAETLSRFMLDGWPDAARFADLIGGVISRAWAAAKSEQAFNPERSARGSAWGSERGPRVVAFGEMVALLWAEGKPEAAVQLEQLWNDLAHTYSFDLRCAYPMSFFRQAADGDSIERICATHSHVIPAESYTSLANEDERLRAIALLQQKAQALETEIEERKKVQQSLERAIADRDEFLSVAAHELKTPVTSLRGFVQLLLRDARQKRESAPQRLEAALNAIESQTGKLTHLVDRLLDMGQIEGGRLRVEPTRIDLAALVRSVLAQQLGDNLHTFAFEGPEHLEAVVDPVRFEQVITNLLDNAVKFSPKGGTVTVGLEQGDEGGEGGIRLSVTDQGVGIPPDQWEAVFGRFQQAHSEGHLSGMGLGLYVTREIVELHGGSIQVEENQPQGSRFVVALPPSATGAQAASRIETHCNASVPLSGAKGSEA
jgi:signal transduction histidine kinase